MPKITSEEMGEVAGEVEERREYEHGGEEKGGMYRIQTDE
jgi:hypothetical protein